MSQNTRNVLVTGGAGFIGTHLVNELVRQKKFDTMDVVDNLSSSSVPERRLNFFKKHNIRFIEASVEEFNPTGQKYDQIYHLASPVGPAGVLKYAGRMGLVILADAVKMADLALRDDAKLLMVSTSEVYGKHPEGGLGQHEDIPKVVPANITVRLEYGVGKLMTEIALLNLAKVKPLHVNFVRPFNIIGPHQNGESGFVVPRFVDAALKGEPITIFGDGSQKRTFTHVQDIVDAFIMIMNSGVDGRIYNVGNPANIASIKELAHKILALCESTSKVDYVDPKNIYGPLYEEAWNKIPDIERISSEVGWAPRWALDDIVSEYIVFARGGFDVLDPDLNEAVQRAYFS
jgi:UDP-glucose 4-epimerase